MSHNIVCEHRRKAGAFLIEGKFRTLFFTHHMGIVVRLDMQAVFVRQADNAFTDGDGNRFFKQRASGFAVIDQVAVDCDDQGVRIQKPGVLGGRKDAGQRPSRGQDEAVPGFDYAADKPCHGRGYVFF